MLAGQRDRWFLGEGRKRKGPIPFEQLIRLLLDEADPRAPLVWHKGFASWTRAEDVPEVERRLAPVLARAGVAADAVRPAGSFEPFVGRAAVAAIDEAKPGSPLPLYGGLAAAVIATALVGWLSWPRPQPPALVVLPVPEPTVAPTVPVPSPHASPSATPSPPPPPTPRPGALFADREADLPPAEVRRLRGVAAWSGETLALTVENRTAWRVTELHVRVSRFTGDDLEPDAAPLLLLPPVEPVARAVAALMNRVAPDRKRPGVNPLDTGSFEARVGSPPEGFRWEIESARGYAPR